MGSLHTFKRVCDRRLTSPKVVFRCDFSFYIKSLDQIDAVHTFAACGMQKEINWLFYVLPFCC